MGGGLRIIAKRSLWRYWSCSLSILIMFGFIITLLLKYKEHGKRHSFKKGEEEFSPEKTNKTESTNPNNKSSPKRASI